MRLPGESQGVKISGLGPTPVPRRATAAAAGPVDRVELGCEPRLEQVLSRAGRPYYDEPRDLRDRQAYYEGVADDLDPQALYHALSDLVEETHSHECGYEPSKYLYDWVDLRPNLRLQSLYASQTVAVDAPVRVASEKDLLVEERVEVRSEPVRKTRHGRKGGSTSRVKTRLVTRSLADQADQWVKALAGAPMDALALAQRIAEIETKNYFNCEHVVPRIWFDDRQPMRGDLHHLFTCEQKSNGLRSNRRLVDLPSYDGADDASGMGMAPYESDEYEPAGGKGPAARATMYFLLRYPGKVGGEGEYSAEDLETLLRWHREDPPGLWEKHRNQAIFGIQGNRNPFIDHPEWAERVDFSRSLRVPPRMPPPRKPSVTPFWQGEPWRRR